MLTTLVIGLREGLEAALIVGIIAAFLRRNGRGLAAMWAGVGLALLLSLAVGLGLERVEESLPQAAQEGMEAVIGAIAVVFVTGMIVWMNGHARDMKRRIEADAAAAIGRHGAFALAAMAFLAVLREGFETSVFLLATLSAAQSAAWAASGALIGLVLAGAIGWGIYAGGVRIPLGRFFRVTGVFLILVAAGLVVTALRSAHEAGWLLGGQQRLFDLSALVAPGTVRAALVTGVLGIPADPRLIEGMGWLAYLVPVSLVLFWPARLRPAPRRAAQLRHAGAAGLTVIALGLATLAPVGTPSVPARAPLLAGVEGTGGPRGSAAFEMAGGPRLVVSLPPAAETAIPLAADAARTEQRGGRVVTVWSIARDAPETDHPALLTLDAVAALAGGRLPVGFNPSRNPGPFAARWTEQRRLTVETEGDLLLDAHETGRTVVTLSGGGLQTPRAVTLAAGADDAAAAWHVDPAYRDAARAALAGKAAAAAERTLWSVELPAALFLAALPLAVAGGRRRARAIGAAEPTPAPAPHRPGRNGPPVRNGETPSRPQGAPHAT
ncbi:iron uptake transporter permease EfeU [Prosthecomicrobium pneumaticum]|uniref:High-affinity iron transporter n=1 Tax=Prosthecomicrobium pneumaticum TaxID=81895 RepID=A0A7W9FLV8_9HYPH|nr:iron uptake transporter permease EfeU [Prosthecomicrobium pneumaticum]MBB5753057.1 high-affinity iron transporter [Prosthecomicrobium pneumaticum]